jgi:hypothetical protein
MQKLVVCPSFVWRSICSSRDLLKDGLQWRVGNGNSIAIWKDKWLPCPSSHKIQSPIQILPAEAKVADLIDVDSGWWNIELIHRIFLPEEAAAICSLALSPHGLPDKLFWQGTPHGNFTVRSAYHLELDRRARQAGECSTPYSAREAWSKIWKLHVPGVVRHFLWRLCTNTLPTRDNLFRRKVIQDSLCPMCGLCQSLLSISYGSVNPLKPYGWTAAVRFKSSLLRQRTVKLV